MSHSQFERPGLIIALLLLGALSLSFARNKPGALPPQPKPEKALLMQAAPDFKQRLRVFVHKDDIRPRVIHAWPGKAVVSVENESETDVSLQIERVLPTHNQAVGGVNLSSRARRSPQELTLVAGEYVLYEASRPNIHSSLIVESRH